jgi:hypothetical protein
VAENTAGGCRQGSPLPIVICSIIKLIDIVDNLRQNGENIEDETLAHISLLPYKHVLPNGTYFIDDRESGI